MSKKCLCIIVCGGRIYPDINNRIDSEMRIKETIKLINDWKKRHGTLPYVILSGNYTFWEAPKGIREWETLRDEYDLLPDLKVGVSS